MLSCLLLLCFYNLMDFEAFDSGQVNGLLSFRSENASIKCLESEIGHYFYCSFGHGCVDFMGIQKSDLK